MPETRYLEEYDGNGKIANRILYTIPDESLEWEQAGKTVAELATMADQDLTLPQVARLAKALAVLRR
jgi:hypothetical protein